MGPLTLSRTKAWELSGYFMGQSVSDVLEAIERTGDSAIQDARNTESLDELKSRLSGADAGLLEPPASRTT